MWLRNQLEAEGNDLLREMVRSLAQGLMSAEADVVCGAPWGQQSPDRVNRRNGYRTRSGLPCPTSRGSVRRPTCTGVPGLRPVSDQSLKPAIQIRRQEVKSHPERIV